MKSSLKFILLGILVLIVVGTFLVRRFTESQLTLPGLDKTSLTSQAVPEHLKALSSPDAAVRKKAAWSLWQIGENAPQATPDLIRVAKDPAPEVRAEAAQALGR